MAFFARACLLTILAEGLFFFVLGERSLRGQALLAAANACTNLLLNGGFALFPSAYRAIFFWEALVVLAEYRILQGDLGQGARLFLKVLAANCLSFGLGQLFF